MLKGCIIKTLPVLAIFLAASLVPAARGDTTAALDAKLTSPPLAGFPLIFDLTITNTSPPGDKPPSFWFGGGDGIYPSAYGFEARITDAAGHILYRHLQNAQIRAGSGGNHPIDVSLTFPAVSDSLTPGDYTLFIFTTGGAGAMQLPPMRSPALRVTIHEDAAAFKLAAQPYSAAPAQVPPRRFTEFVGVTYGFSPIVDQWLADLAKPDSNPANVRTAAIYLASVHRLPAGGEAILKEAIAQLQKQFAGNGTAEQGRIVQSLIQCAANLASDAGTDIVLSVVQGNSPERLFAVRALGDCPPGKRVDNVLLTLSKDSDANIAQQAMMVLGIRGNPIALPFAKEAFKKNDNFSPNAAGRILFGLSDDPDARRVIKDAFADPQSSIHNFAPKLLTRLQLLEQGPATRP